MKKRVIAIIAIELGLLESEITPTSSLRLLTTDSLEIVYLIQQLENEFNVEIPDETAQKFITVNDAIRYLEIN